MFILMNHSASLKEIQASRLNEIEFGLRTFIFEETSFEKLRLKSGQVSGFLQTQDELIQFYQ